MGIMYVIKASNNKYLTYNNTFVKSLESYKVKIFSNKKDAIWTKMYRAPSFENVILYIKKVKLKEIK